MKKKPCFDCKKATGICVEGELNTIAANRSNVIETNLINRALILKLRMPIIRSASSIMHLMNWGRSLGSSCRSPSILRKYLPREISRAVR